MSPLHQIVIGLATSFSLATYAFAQEVPAVCSFVADLGNQGRLADFNLQRDPKDAGPAEPCSNMSIDGRDECIDTSDSPASDQDLSLRGPDGELLRLARDPDENWSRNEIEKAARRGTIAFEGQYYFVYGAAVLPTYLASIDAKGVLKIQCEFVARDGLLRIATPYERLIRSAGNADVWVTAFTRSGTQAAELLIANGHEVPETIDFMPALSWAISHHRADAVEWLLQHGAQVNANHPSDMPVVRAIWVGDAALATRLVQLGADPLPVLKQLGELSPATDSKDSRSLIMATVRRLGYIPEPVILHAIDRAPALLEDLARSRLTVRLVHREWHAGRQATLPFAVRADAYRKGSAEMIRELKRIYKRATLPPVSDTSARLSYGSFEHGLMIQRGERSSVSDEELLRFATSACIYLGMHDCGPKRLQQSARAWVETLHYDCPEQARRVLTPSACSLLMHYLHPTKPPFLQPVVTYQVTLRTELGGSAHFAFDLIQNVYLGKSSR